ncbi:MAG: LOG family protein [Phycisphaerales bacterium]|nr:LOG family protein [Phycisphaerales bacterium]
MEHHRQELNPPGSTDPKDESAAPPEIEQQKRVDAPDVLTRLNALIADVGGDPSSFDGKLVRDLLIASLKLIPDGRDTGELKLMAAALKELRYAYRVFGQYPDPHLVTIFGSARTPADHPDYRAAVEFSRLMAATGWMVITGAGDGIMKAGHEGPGREASFGVAIRLPFETTANDVIAGDEKLIHFRYFFTRKLMFLSQAEAVVLFPGGFGTMDEGYETLTLIQTGKASMIPVVLLEGEGGTYWDEFVVFVRDTLLAKKMISEEDLNLMYHASTPEDAVEHVRRFYRNYHSSRYVRDDLVIRLKGRLKDEDVEALNEEFGVLVKKGRITQCGAYDAEEDHRELHRLAFTHTKHKFGLVRKLIDRINGFDPA